VVLAASSSCLFLPSTPLLPGGLPGLHRTQKKNRKKKNGKIQKNKVFVLCGIVGKRAFIAPVISVVGA
jgi:hypothetical protein